MNEILPRLHLIKSYINSLNDYTTIIAKKWPECKVAYKYKSKVIKQLISKNDPIIRNTNYGYIVIVNDCGFDLEFTILLSDIIPFIYNKMI